jgi:predicted peptidase
MLRNLCTGLTISMLIFSLAACKKEVNAVNARKELLNHVVETDPAILKAVNQKVGYNIAGYYSALPVYYDSTSKSYPLIIFIHGAEQYGNGGAELPRVLTDGIPALLNNKKFPPSFTVNGNNYSFIVLAPQLVTNTSIAEIQTFIEYAEKTYRIDEHRIYLTGISLGAILSWQMGIEHTNELAAIVPFSGIDTGSVKTNNAAAIARGNLPVWAFQNNDDPIVDPSRVKSFIALINSYSPAIAPRLTANEQGGHDTWAKGTDPAYRENGMNIYEWMLQYNR